MGASPERETVTVLVVDDERNVADLYATWVEMEDGHETRVAYDGQTALETLVELERDTEDPETTAVDAVFLDRRMPDMSGDEVLVGIRERGYDVPVAMVTAVKPDDEPLEADYQEYLTKPVMRDDVRRALRTLLAATPGDGAVESASTPESDPEAETETEADDAAADETADTSDGEVSEDVRETLSDVTERLDQIQESVEHGAEDEDEDEDGDDTADDLVTAEDVRTRVSGSSAGDDEE